MQDATIVGAGIAGPMAAIALSDAGHRITIADQRQPNEFRSLHMISLDDDVLDILSEHGIQSDEITRPEVRDGMPRYMTDCNGEDEHTRFAGNIPPGVVWDDVHNALVRRVGVLYGHRITGRPSTPIVVWADGVGSTGREMDYPETGNYAGEMLFRGLSPRVREDLGWYNVAEADDSWEMVSYPTWDETGMPLRGWTLFTNVTRKPWDGTENLNGSQADKLIRRLSPLSHTPMRLISTAKEIKASPQYVWSGIRSLTRRTPNGIEYLIGDAIATVSPRTASGANLAIREAASITTMSAAQWDRTFTRLAKRTQSLSAALLNVHLPGIHG